MAADDRGRTRSRSPDLHARHHDSSGRRADYYEQREHVRRPRRRSRSASPGHGSSRRDLDEARHAREDDSRRSTKPREDDEHRSSRHRRDRSRSRSPGRAGDSRRRRRRRSSGSASDDDDDGASSSSSSSSSQETDRKRKEKRDKSSSDKKKKKKSRRVRSRSRSRERDRDRDRDRRKSKEDKRERRRRKEEKRAKRAAKKAKKSGAIVEYGKYGVLNESDFYSKDSEFRAWLIEERHLNPEVVPNSKLKDLFKTFAEDWNTVTLPEKYYDLDAHERKLRAIANGETLAQQEEVYDFRKDEADIKTRQKASEPKRRGLEDELSHEALMELRRVQRERIEGSQMKRLGLKTKDSLGVRYE